MKLKLFVSPGIAGGFLTLKRQEKPGSHPAQSQNMLQNVYQHLRKEKEDESEALAGSLAEKACVDIGFMAILIGGSEKAEQIITDLNGVIFRNSAKATDELYTGWETADEYLSGNIREKLKTAGIYAESHPEYAVNVQSLEVVLPEDLTASEISVRLGATWLPPEMIQQFMFELLSTPRYNQ